MRPDGFARVVRASWRKTQGYLVAGAPRCMRIRDDGIRHIQRRLTPVALDGVGAVRPVGSWFMAVIACPGDDLTGLASWAVDRDVGRIHFYLHADAGLEVLRPWLDAGLPVFNMAEGFTSWQGLHKVLGWDLNVPVYRDHQRT